MTKVLELMNAKTSETPLNIFKNELDNFLKPLKTPIHPPELKKSGNEVAGFVVFSQ